jgi:DNA-binding NarL/FixJ family response regulator
VPTVADVVADPPSTSIVPAVDDGDIKVLVVDDTDHVRRMLDTMLSMDGFEVVGTAGNGEEAISEADALDPDVVVIDYMMPGMDGLECARQMRQRRPNQLVIIYTAFIDAAVEQAAADAGVALCVGKVEGLHLLEKEIRRLVHLR